jgi:hypothetical protein
MGIITAFRTFSCLLPLFLSVTAGTEATPPLRASAAIELHLNAPADLAFPLFGPARESEWAPTWAPKWIYPPEPRQSPEGAVFTTVAPEGVSIWVMTVFDPEKRDVEYVHLIPGHRVTEISIIVRPAGSAASVARVSYRVTALSQDGSAFVAHFAKNFPSEGQHWERAINDSISKNGLRSGSDHGAVPVKPN